MANHFPDSGGQWRRTCPPFPDRSPPGPTHDAGKDRACGPAIWPRKPFVPARGEAVMAESTVSVNRAAVLTLWAAVVAERLGFDAGEALSLGRAVAGLNAQSKGRRLGIFKPHERKAKESREKGPGERFRVEVCGRAVPAV